MSGSVDQTTRGRLGRIVAFDGLRGVAALTVVIFHFLALLYPYYTPAMLDSSAEVAHTPLHILWNGNFAVAVFFVLSGFVMAAAADRRPDSVVANSAARYMRLALPVTVSCVLAWLWLTAFPIATETLAVTVDEPSGWLLHTYQDDIKPVHYAVADGLAASFWRGHSGFNNVLWTMQIELLGSLGLFVLYRLAKGRARGPALLLSGSVIVLFLPEPYLAFVLGAGLYEAHKHGILRRLPTILPPLALALGILLGGPGVGAHERLGLPEVPEQWHLGAARGMVPIVAAALLLYATLTLRPVGLALSTTVPLWLGRVSFGLYLVHVPPLYTIVAWASVNEALPPALLAAAYFIGMLLLAWVFTITVDEPVIRRLAKLRAELRRRIARAPLGNDA